MAANGKTTAPPVAGPVGDGPAEASAPETEAEAEARSSAAPDGRKGPLREKAMQALGEAVLALSAAPRYQDQSLGDLHRWSSRP